MRLYNNFMSWVYSNLFLCSILLPVYYCAQEICSCHHRRDAKHLKASHLNKSFVTCLSEHGVTSHLRLVNVYNSLYFSCLSSYSQSKVCTSIANCGLSEVVIRGSLQGKKRLGDTKEVIRSCELKVIQYNDSKKNKQRSTEHYTEIKRSNKNNTNLA